jgi:hypothetical protein
LTKEEINSVGHEKVSDEQCHHFNRGIDRLKSILDFNVVYERLYRCWETPNTSYQRMLAEAQVHEKKMGRMTRIAQGTISRHRRRSSLMDMVEAMNHPPQKKRFQRIVQKMLAEFALRYSMGIGLYEHFENEIFPNRCFLMEGTQDLFLDFKLGEEFKVMRAITRQKNFIFQIDKSGRTLLHWAVRRDALMFGNFLMRGGSFVDAVDFYEFTPMDYAVKNNSLKMIVLLLNYDASPFCKYIRDAKGVTMENVTFRVKS